MGTVIVSIDAELVGGIENLHDGVPRKLIERNRRRWTELVDVLDEYDVQATWAVVGRLFEAERSTEYLRPSEWYSDQGTSSTAEELMRIDREVSAPDLVQLVVDAEVNHEIASHSYSHIRFTDATPEMAANDAAAWRVAAPTDDISTIVFPYNDVDHLDVLTDEGLRSYRGTPPTTPGEATRQAVWSHLPVTSLVPASVKALATEVTTAIAEAVDHVFGGPPPLVEPIIDDRGLVAIPSSLPSLFRLSRDYPWLVSALRSISVRPHVRTARQGIDAAAGADGIFHLWFHPFDFRTESDLESLERILAYLAERRDEGAIEVATMESVAERYIEEP